MNKILGAYLDLLTMVFFASSSLKKLRPLDEKSGGNNKVLIHLETMVVIPVNQWSKKPSRQRQLSYTRKGLYIYYFGGWKAEKLVREASLAVRRNNCWRGT